MDSVNWGSLERARVRQVSPPSWDLNGPKSSTVNFSNFDQNFDFARLNIAKARNNESFSAHCSERNGLQSESQLMDRFMSSSMKSSTAVPTASASTEAFGHWKPVYDEKSKPVYSLTGTEIWAANAPDAATQRSRNTDEWNSASSFPQSSSLNDGGRNSIGVNEMLWGGGKSSTGSDMETASQLVGRGSYQGWGKTPVSQEKPWDLSRDGAIVETGGVLQDDSNLSELCQDSLSLLKSSGEPLGMLSNRQLRMFETLPQDGVASKSSGVDVVQLLMELQKLGSVDAVNQGELNQSRRGSSVSSIDGITHSSIIGRKDSGYEPPGNVHWMDKQRPVQSHKDEWNLGSRMSSGMQSPSGWSSVSGSEKVPPVDDGTSVWAKQHPSEKPTSAEDTALAWSRLLKGKAEYPSSVSAFNVDISIPPPALNASSALLQNVASVASAASLLSNLQPSGNFPARQMSVPMSTSCGGFGSAFSDGADKSWMRQGPQHCVPMRPLVQKPSLGSQWSSMDAWNIMQRKNIGIPQNKAPQTRSKLIQQFVSMGFKREDVQNALITNNMDLDRALAELLAKHRAAMVRPDNLGLHLGRLPQIHSGSGDLFHGSVSGRPLGVAGFSNDVVANSLDLSRLLNGPTDWDSHLANSDQTISPTVLLPTMSRNPPLSNQSIYPVHNPPGLHPNIGGRDPLSGGYGGFSPSLSELLLLKKLSENGQNSFPPVEAELLKLFGQPISHSDLNNRTEYGAASYWPKSASSKNTGNVSEGVGHASVSDDIFLSGNTPLPSAFESKEFTKLEMFNIDGFNTSLPSVSRQLSVNVAAAHDGDIGTVGKIQSGFNSHNSSPDVGPPKLSLPSALEIKEFIPGVPWKGAPVDPSRQPEPVAEVESTSSSAAMVFKDMVKSLAKGKEETNPEDRVPDRLPSSWIRLNDVSDKLDDDILQTLCSTYGEVKVFRDKDNSVLLFYTHLHDAVKAQLALNDSQLKDLRLTAEFVDEWAEVPESCDASAPDETSEGSQGYLTFGGLWIPPNSDAAQPYYGAQDKWYDDALLAEDWQDGDAHESVVSTVCRDSDNGNSQ